MMYSFSIYVLGIACIMTGSLPSPPPTCTVVFVIPLCPLCLTKLPAQTGCCKSCEGYKIKDLEKSVLSISGLLEKPCLPSKNLMLKKKIMNMIFFISYKY